MVDLKDTSSVDKIWLKDDFVITLNTSNDDERSVYITGSFNNWKAKDEVFEMTKEEEGQYSFRFPKGAVFHLPFEFKFLKGTWKDVELDTYGSKMDNRLIDDFDKDWIFTVDRWTKDGLSFDVAYYPLVETVSEEFEIPQLGKTRRVRILLPYNYKETEERYPVIYLQDAQNLFNERSPFGNWAIDKRMAVMAEQEKGNVIIVAIDHGGKERIDEFSLLDEELQVGEGKKFARFMADTLKPFIDNNYRTKPEPEYSGLGGSSMGGLITIITALLYPEVFSRVMIFSPSIWAAKRINIKGIHFFDPGKAKFYVYSGAKESKSLLGDVERFVEALKANTDNEEFKIKLHIHPEGTHSEGYWSKAFPHAIDWLFYEE